MAEATTSADVVFADIGSVDTQRLCDSLRRFGKWRALRIEINMPVSVELPSAIRMALETLYQRSTKPDSADYARHLEKRFVSELEHGVRTLAAAAIRPDGSRAFSERDDALDVYLKSQCIALARALLAILPDGKARDGFRSSMPGLIPSQRFSIIDGLVHVIQNTRNWKGWTDADLLVGSERFRLNSPIGVTVNCSMFRWVDYSIEEVRRIFVPQMLSYCAGRSRSFEAIGGVFLCPFEKDTKLMDRNEFFLDWNVTGLDSEKSKAEIVGLIVSEIESRTTHLDETSRQLQRELLTIGLGALGPEVRSRLYSVANAR